MEKNFEEFGEMLFMVRKQSIESFAKQSMLIGCATGLLVLYAGLFVLESEKIALLSCPAFFLPIALNYFFVQYLFEKRKKKLEGDVPDLLLSASSMPKSSDIEKLVSFLAADKETVLGKEFWFAELEIKAGSPIKTAFERMKKRNKSKALSRSLDLLLNASESGADMGDAFRETAQDFMETSAILREQAASATIQKYTLLFAGGLLVPMIIGLVTGMVSQMGFSMANEIGIGMEENLRKELFNAASLASIVYIAEYALIASFFVAFQENSPKKFILYASIIMPLGFLVYFFAIGF